MASKQEPLYPFFSKSRLGFFNRDLEIVLPAIYQDGDARDSLFGRFFEGRTLVELEDYRYAYIDTEGRVLTSDDWCWDPPLQFSEGLAAVKFRGKKWGFINSDGEMVIPPQFDEVEPFSCGLAVVKDDEGMPLGFINKQGELVIDAAEKRATYLFSFNEGLAGVSLDNKKAGYIDVHGNWVIEPVYDHVGYFEDGLGKVCINGKDGCVDHTGKIVIEPQFKMIVRFCEGLSEFYAFDKLGLKGVINLRGEIVVPPTYGGIGFFSEGLACAWLWKEDWKAPNQAGVIDTKGNMVIPPTFCYVEEFNHGLAKVGTSEMNPDWDSAYIDQTGRMVWRSWRGNDQIQRFR